MNNEGINSIYFILTHTVQKRKTKMSKIRGNFRKCIFNEKIKI